MKKKKTYTIDVLSHVSATMEVEAYNKEDALAIAYDDMEKSLARKILEAKRNPTPKISNLDGWVEAHKTTIRLKKT